MVPSVTQRLLRETDISLLPGPWAVALRVKTAKVSRNNKQMPFRIRICLQRLIRKSACREIIDQSFCQTADNRALAANLISTLVRSTFVWRLTFYPMQAL